MTDPQPRAGVPADAVVDPLCDAFADYPVMRYVLGPGGDYRARLRTLVGFFLVARTLRHDPILATYDGGEVSGVAICTLPGLPGTPDLEEAREWTWASLGNDAKKRYGEWIRVWEPLGVAEPNIHVNMLGVPPRFQGRGLGRLLLERVHVMSRQHPDSRESASPPRARPTSRFTNTSATGCWATAGSDRGSRPGASSGRTEPPARGVVPPVRLRGTVG
jgi:GNAT superfamily N-acetyltransferase